MVDDTLALAFVVALVAVEYVADDAVEDEVAAIVMARTHGVAVSQFYLKNGLMWPRRGIAHNPGIAVIGNKPGVDQTGISQVTGHAGAAATKLLLCTSREGIHLLSQSSGKIENYLYQYLGYDIENPTCAAEQLQPVDAAHK